MPFPIILEIIPSGNNGWDCAKARKIIFRNKSKAEFFCMYYTGKYSCLIRYYTAGIWMATYCKGKQIWNIY